MIYHRTKESLLYKELSAEDSKRYFDLSRQKFVHNIDSFYYSVSILNDWEHDPAAVVFRDYLEIQRQKAVNSLEPHVLDYLGTDYVMNGIGSKPYLWDLEKKDQYMMFFLSKKMNDKTPEIWVQIRSQYLWLYGEYYAIEHSLKDIESLLGKFGLQIKEVKENRIDYAYHTNYIQDPLSFFKEKDLNRMQQSRFSRASKEYNFVGDFDIECDYMTLGRKKSNNLFFRVYDKTKEVIEQGYKQFFIKLWYMENLISYFDYCCIESAFENNSHRYLDIARLEFYLEHGTNEIHKQAIRDMLSKKNRDYEEIVSLANLLTPKVTVICNVEIETKRKFYYTLDESVSSLLKVKSKNVPEYAEKLYRILDNKQVFTDFITRNNSDYDGVIRFVDYKFKNKTGNPYTRKSEMPTANWWKRLQSCKVNKRHDAEKVTLLREYQKTLDLVLMKKRAVNAVTSYNIYRNIDDPDTNIYDDSLDFLSTLNENDVENAKKYKTKKITQLNARLADLEKTSSEKVFRLLDSSTGEIVENNI